MYGLGQWNSIVLLFQSNEEGLTDVCKYILRGYIPASPGILNPRLYVYDDHDDDDNDDDDDYPVCVSV